MNKDCVVLFPVYRPLDEGERNVIRRALGMTPGFEARFIAPHSFVPDGSFAGFENVAAERFDDRFFDGIPGYNRLMLDPDFYGRFRDFKYVLIHQTDAYIFKPELRQWCDRGWDYIGAPWYKRQKLARYDALQKRFWKHKSPGSCKYLLRQARYNNVGNGGFSLRRTETFLRVLEAADPELLAKYRGDGDSIRNEDVFWGIQARAVLPEYRVPDWREGLLFSVERRPGRSFEVLGDALPFGCHAYRKIEPEVWRKFIPAEYFSDAKV